MAKDSKASFSELTKNMLDSLEMEYTTTREKDGVTYFTVKAKPDETTTLTVNMDVDAKGECNYRCYPVFSVPAAKWTDMYIALNNLNRRYRFISLFMDDDGDICATYNLNTYKVNDDAAFQAVTKLRVFARIVNRCIPEIEKVLATTKEPTVIIRTNPFSKP